MTAIRTETILDVHNCARCGILYAAPRDFLARKQKAVDANSWYCPNGHSQVFRDNDAERFQKLYEQEVNRNKDAKVKVASLQEFNDQLANDLMDKAKEVKNLKKRVAAGVCPDCHRTFKQLASHMKSKHSA